MAKNTNRPQNKNLTPGSTGRPKGVLNKRTKHAQEFAQSFLRLPEFQATLLTVMGDATHEHWRWTTELLMHYAYGKPAERAEVHQTSDGSMPPMQIGWMDFRQFTEQQHGVPDDSAPL